MTLETKKAGVSREIFKEPPNTDIIAASSDPCISTEYMDRFHILFPKKAAADCKRATTRGFSTSKKHSAKSSARRDHYIQIHFEVYQKANLSLGTPLFST